MYQPDNPDPNREDTRENNRNVGSEAEQEANREPAGDTSSAHPLGVGVGAASGGATGAVIGAAAGPVGAVVGAAVGGVVGALIGEGVAESIHPKLEHDYWRAHYSDRSYVQPGATYETYGPAYQFGWESWLRYPERDFDEIEPELRQEWETTGGDRDLNWDHAKEAVRDAWNRVREATIGPGRRHDTGY